MSPEDKAYLKQCINEQRQQYPNGALGVISSYDRYTNTATVIVSRPDTDEVEEIMHRVPCPVLLGVQAVAPEPGRPCFLVFKGGNRSQALITHYYNHRYDQADYDKQTRSHVGLPSYLIGS